MTDEAIRAQRRLRAESPGRPPAPVVPGRGQEGMTLRDARRLAGREPLHVCFGTPSCRCDVTLKLGLGTPRFVYVCLRGEDARAWLRARPEARRLGVDLRDDARWLDAAIAKLGADWPQEEHRDAAETAVGEMAPPSPDAGDPEVSADGPDSTAQQAETPDAAGSTEGESGSEGPGDGGQDGAADTGTWGQHGTGPGGCKRPTGGGTPGEDQRQEPGDDPAQAGVAGSGSAPGVSFSARGAGKGGHVTPQGQGAKSDESPTPDGDGEPGEEDAARAGDAQDSIDPGAVEAERAGAEPPPTDPERDSESVEDGSGRGRHSVRVRATDGGWYADRVIALKLSRAQRKDAARVRRALESLVRDWQVGVGQRPSPRVAPRALARELASRRVSLSRCRREEMEPARVLLMCDVSGSCSAVATATLAACYAVAAEMPDQVEVVEHSNGFPLPACVTHGVGYCSCNSAAWGREERGEGKYDPGPRRIAGVVVFGDHDAADVYERLAARAPLVWLDSYCACDGPKPASRKLRAPAARWAAQPVAWWQGINDAARAADALRRRV